MEVNEIILGLLAFFIAIGLLILLVIKRNNPNFEPDYRAIFIVGISWIPIGIVTKVYYLSAFAMFLIVVALLNREKWRVKTKWSELDKKTKTFKLSVIALMFMLFILGIALVFVH